MAHVRIQKQKRELVQGAVPGNVGGADARQERVADGAYCITSPATLSNALNRAVDENKRSRDGDEEREKDRAERAECQRFPRHGERRR